MSDQALFDRIHRHHRATTDTRTPTLPPASDISLREQSSEPSSSLIGPWAFPSAGERTAQPIPHHFDSASVSPKCTYATYDDAAGTISDEECIDDRDRRRHYADLSSPRWLDASRTADGARDMLGLINIPGIFTDPDFDVDSNCYGGDLGCISDSHIFEGDGCFPPSTQRPLRRIRSFESLIPNHETHPVEFVASSRTDRATAPRASLTNPETTYVDMPCNIAHNSVAAEFLTFTSIPGLSGGSTSFSTGSAPPSNVGELSTSELVRVAKQLTEESERIASELERRQPADDNHSDDGDAATHSSCLRGGVGDTSPTLSAVPDAEVHRSSVSPFMIDAGTGAEETAERNCGCFCTSPANVPLPPSPGGVSVYGQASGSHHDSFERTQGTEDDVLGSTTLEPWRISQEQREDAADFFYRKAVQEGYDHAWLMSREYLTGKKDSKIPALLEQVAAERTRVLQEQEDYYFALSLDQTEQRRAHQQMERLWSDVDVQRALHRTIHGESAYDGNDELELECGSPESSGTKGYAIPGKLEKPESGTDPTKLTSEIVDGSSLEYPGVQLPMRTKNALGAIRVLLEYRRSANFDREVERIRLLSNMERHQADIEQANAESLAAEEDRSEDRGQGVQVPQAEEQTSLANVRDDAVVVHDGPSPSAIGVSHHLEGSAPSNMGEFSERATQAGARNHSKIYMGASEDDQGTSMGTLSEKSSLDRSRGRNRVGRER
ncbi:hypothetical protein LTR37_020892 [Vermiconidia calcicola]|uniref:Uncharacterized protein n=1 Tax=Vermiconidia calcicola TaxID=1690605 RepID=A0ACC3MD03_9PEZI|nr:hypothetical protein LTR37_020892 [Vermiconidia calcicola]